MIPWFILSLGPFYVLWLTTIHLYPVLESVMKHSLWVLSLNWRATFDFSRDLINKDNKGSKRNSVLQIASWLWLTRRNIFQQDSCLPCTELLNNKGSSSGVGLKSFNFQVRTLSLSSCPSLINPCCLWFTSTVYQFHGSQSHSVQLFSKTWHSLNYIIICQVSATNLINNER